MAEGSRRIVITLTRGRVRTNIRGVQEKRWTEGGFAPRGPDELEEFSQMLNMVSRRDINGTGLQVFRWILENRMQTISSSRMSETCDMNRLTCLHHLKRMEELGIVRNVDGRYVMESESMEQYIDRLEKEAEETFAALRQLAKSIDRKYARREIKVK
jgi:hypothetical protein